MDFTVTQKGLEEQLLGRVIGKEQKALEEQLSDVLEEVNSNTKVRRCWLEGTMVWACSVVNENLPVAYFVYNTTLQKVGV